MLKQKFKPVGSIFTVLSLCLSLLSYPVMGGSLKTFYLDPNSGAVVFKAIGRPSALKITGKGNAPRGEFKFSDEKMASGSATFDLNSLDTGIEGRDKHMKEKYLETQKYPDAKLTLQKITLTKNALGESSISADSVPFEGLLRLHGIEKPISGSLKVSGDSHAAKVEAQFKLKLADYGIAVPSFAGITVANEVEVSVQTSGTF